MVQQKSKNLYEIKAICHGPGVFLESNTSQ
jgi:hypothetical protein